jgi:RNA polymerase sigma factor (sigma-70 family)
MTGNSLPEETAAPLLASLVRKAQAGDPVAFSELVARFEAYAMRRAYALLRDRPLAEDAVQEAFLEASLKLHQLQIPEAFPGWFSRIVFKRCDRFTRGKKLAAVALEQALEVADGAERADALAASEEAHAALRDALAALPDHERPLVEAFYLAGQSQQELSVATGLPVTTIKKRLYAARQRLRKVLSASEAAAPDAPETRHAFSPAEQLFMAAWHGFGGQADALLAADPALADSLNTDGMGVLLFAAHAAHHTGRRAVVEVLLRRGAPVGLHAAAALGLQDRVQTLVSALPEQLDAPGPWGRTPLHWAVCAGHAPLALWLLGRGADLHRADSWGCTPLHLAADFGHEVLLSALLAQGADPAVAMKNGKRPVHLAASHRSVPIVRALLQRGATLDVFAVAALGDVRRAETLLRARPESLDATLNLGATPIHVAAECGRADMVRFLAEQGARVDVVTAAHLGRLGEVDRLLKEAPEAVNERAGSFGFTALHYASVRGWGALARVLLSHGADTGLTDRMYLKTPLDEALYFGRADLAQLLRSHPRSGR